MENLKELLTFYLSQCRYEKKLSLATLKAYTIDLNQFIVYLGDHPEQNQADVITRYFRSRIVRTV